MVQIVDKTNILLIWNKHLNHSLWTGFDDPYKGKLRITVHLFVFYKQLDRPSDPPTPINPLTQISIFITISAQ